MCALLLLLLLLVVVVEAAAAAAAAAIVRIYTPMRTQMTTPTSLRDKDTNDKKC